jgi:hypothetical protein
VTVATLCSFKDPAATLMTESAGLVREKLTDACFGVVTSAPPGAWSKGGLVRLKAKGLKISNDAIVLEWKEVDGSEGGVASLRQSVSGRRGKQRRAKRAAGEASSAAGVLSGGGSKRRGKRARTK